MNRAVATGSPLMSLPQTAIAPSATPASDGFALAVDAALAAPLAVPTVSTGIVPPAPMLATPPPGVATAADGGALMAAIAPLAGSPERGAQLPDRAGQPGAAPGTPPLAPPALLPTDPLLNGAVTPPAFGPRLVLDSAPMSIPTPTKVPIIAAQATEPGVGTIQATRTDKPAIAPPSRSGPLAGNAPAPVAVMPTAQNDIPPIATSLPGVLAAQAVTTPDTRASEAVPPAPDIASPQVTPPRAADGKGLLPDKVNALTADVDPPAGAEPNVAAPPAPILRPGAGKQPKAMAALSATASVDTIAIASRAPPVAPAPLVVSAGNEDAVAPRASAAAEKPEAEAVPDDRGPAAPIATTVSVVAMVAPAPDRAPDRAPLAPPAVAEAKPAAVSGKGPIRVVAAPGPELPIAVPSQAGFAALATTAAAQSPETTAPKADPVIGGAIDAAPATPLAVAPSAQPAVSGRAALGQEDTPQGAKIAAAPVTAEPVAVARPGQIGRDVGVAIAHRLSAGGDELVVRLVPAELGRIEVRMSFDERGGLRAVIAADSPVALDMLRRDSADLSRSLSDAGVRSDAQSLRFQTDSGSGGTNGQQRSPWLDADSQAGRTARDAGAPEDPEPAAYRSIRTSGSYNLLA